jgi:hypothetical protein
MNESGERPGPLDVAALADLDAGLPDEALAARARTAAAADPEAAAVLDALATTRAELAALPTPEVPPAVAARWAAALATEAGRRPDGTSPRHVVSCRGSGAVATRVTGPPGSPWRRPGRRAWPPLVAAAVLAAVVATGLGALVHRPAPAVSRVELVALGRAAVGTMDVGDLADPARRAACLRAVAPAAEGETLLGGRNVVLHGRPGVLLVLATGTTGGLRILTVDPTCGGPEGGTLIAQLVVE